MATAKPPASRAPRVPKTTPTADAGKPPATLIDARIAELGGWRGDVLAHVRAVILSADPKIVEEWKWNVPVWSCQGIVCTGEAYSKAVKLTFAKGAHLPDPGGLFNASLTGNLRRAIDIPEGGVVDAEALRELIRAAIRLNAS